MAIKFFACGDVVCSTTKGAFIHDDLKQIIKKCDISICNFEAPIKANVRNAIPKAGPHLFQLKETVSRLNSSGFNFVSLANNHIYDFGQEALVSTINELRRCSVNYVGAGKDFNDAYKFSIIERNGIKLGIIAGCENEFGCLPENQNRGGYAWLLHHLVEDNVRLLKTQCDIVIVVAHAGVENIEVPIKEWREKYKRFCDIGADVIIGHHPHVPQGYESYNNSMIFYSLGNLYFDTAGFENKSDDSYSVILEFEKTGLKNFNVIYHKKILGITSIVNKKDVSFSIERLNSLLGADYVNASNDICLELFTKYYYQYYQNALGSIPSNRSLFVKSKKLLSNFLYKNKSKHSRNLLLLHNLRIDSHRYVVQRALSLISERSL